jgi:hypothetical protein
MLAPVAESKVIRGKETAGGAGERVVGWGRASEGADALLEYPVVVNGVPAGVTPDVLTVEGVCV